LTTAIPAQSPCSVVVAALESLPNNVIPVGSIECDITTHSTVTAPLSWAGTYSNTHGRVAHTYNYNYLMAFWSDLTTGNSDAPWKDAALPNSWVLPGATATANAALQAHSYLGDIYRIKFTQNPGALKEPQIEVYLDGKRPSLLAGVTSLASKIVTFVSTDGQQGESNDYFADHCDGVTATIAAVTGNTATDYVALASLDTNEISLLKACLGDANGDATDNVEVQNWDYGSATYPHLIKLVRTVTSYQDGGYYAALYWDGSSKFRLLNTFIPPDNFATDTYDIYTTRGVLEETSSWASALFAYGSHYIATSVKGLQNHSLYDGTEFDGDLACESPASPQPGRLLHCMNKTDLFTVLSFNSPRFNPPYINLYTAKRVWTTPSRFSAADNALFGGNLVARATYGQQNMKRGTHLIETDLALNWGADDSATEFRVYKFVPDRRSTYNYVAPCSNRGICGTDTGVCACFPGYTSDSCAVQNSLAL